MTETVTHTRPTAEEAALLLHALCEWVGREAGVRVLAIKGPVVAIQGLRAPRSSADIDVLVHPEELRAFADRMRALGWYDAVEPSGPRLIAAHSANLLHDHWPLGIDVHHYFPGFLADPGTVFDRLWDRRVEVELAGVPVPACDPVGQVAVVALHLLRSHPDGRSPVLEDLRDRTLQTLSPAQLEELVELAVDTESAWPLRPFLLELGCGLDDPEKPTDAAALAAWNTATLAVEAEGWLRLLAEAPARRWPRIVWHAVMLTDEELLAHHQLTRDEANLRRLRWQRLRRGLAAVPPAALKLIRERRSG